MRYVVFADEGGKWRWHIVAGNGRLVAASGESFASKRNAKRALTLLLQALTYEYRNLPVHVVERA